MYVALTVNAVFCADDLLQSVVGLATNLHSLGEAGRSSREKHKLLEGELVTRVRATVDNVEGRGGEDERRLHTSKISKMLVERNTLLSSTSIEGSDGNTKNSVGAKLALVGGTVEFDEEIIDILLGSNFEAGLDKLGGDNVVYVGNGLEDTLIG